MRYFLDTEFIERGASEPLQFLSIGIVAEDGREFYYERPLASGLIAVDFARHNDAWLTNNVAPHLRGVFFDIASLRTFPSDLIDFCGDAPEFWAYYADYDWVVLCQIFGRMIDLPKSWPMYCRDLKQLVDTFRGLTLPKQDRPDELPEHHALNDARWTKRAYEEIKRQLDDIHPLDLSYTI